MIRRALLAAAALSALIARADAQQCIYNFDPDPTTGAGLSQYPFGEPNPNNQGTGWRVQFLLHRSRFQNVPVRIVDLGFAMATDGIPSYGSFRVEIGYTTREALHSTMSVNPAGALQTVLDVVDHVLPLARNEWNEVGLQVPFLYVPAAGNLLVQVTVDEAVFVHPPRGHYLVQSQDFFVVGDIRNGQLITSGSHVREAPKIRVCIDRAAFSWFGRGCAGSLPQVPGLGLQGSSQLGGTVEIVLSNAPPSAFAFLAFGWDTSPPFPMDLGPLGLNGCSQYFDPFKTVGIVCDSRGIGSHRFGIPNQTSLIALLVYTQYYPVAPGANAVGVITSNYGRILTGL